MRVWCTHQAEFKRLREDVETLLEAARWSSGVAARAKPTRILLEDWLSESMGRWRLILGSEAKLERIGQPLERIMIELDLKALNLIADNLVDNARKYAKGKPALRIYTERVKKRWRIRFEDQGWGFQPDDARRIFSRFSRLKTGAPTAIPGTGLGLFLAENASHQIGLTLRAQSDGPGKGAVFTVEGPLLKERSA